MSKIAISLPEEVLRAIESARKASGESRSQFLRRAVEAYLRRQKERDLDEQYIRGYVEQPETPQEAGGLYSAGLAALAQEPWDDGDNR
jgi:metal-responsive CopG/Arc/MetJ family transcriptional regulator